MTPAAAATLVLGTITLAAILLGAALDAVARHRTGRHSPVGNALVTFGPLVSIALVVNLAITSA